MKRFFWLTAIMCSALIASGAWAADLMIYFDYEEIADGVVSDVSGNGYDGAVSGDVTLAGGVFGNAAQFAQGSYLDLDGENIAAGETPTEAFTICAWINIENTGEHHALFNARAADSTWLTHPEARDTDNQYRWLLRTDGGDTIFDIRAGVPVVGEWVHFAGTYSRADGVGILYIDGEEVGREDARIADAPIAGDWGMGARVGLNIDDARPFTGLMDEFSIWSIALSVDEVVDLMDNGPASSVMAPVITAVSPQDKLSATWAELKKAQ